MKSLTDRLRLGALAALVSQMLVLQALALDTQKVEREIHRLTNAMRAEKGVAPLQPLPELDSLARNHSINMAQNGFFSHSDPEGRSPFDRMEHFLPGLLTMGSAENIAMRGLSGDDELMVALGLVTQWRNSPGHYSNIMNPAYRQLGVGIGTGSGNVYATQNFTSALVMLETDLPKRAALGQSVKLSFRFLGDFPKAQLSVFLTVPDKSARFPTSSGSFYTGGGPLQPVWTDASSFELTIPVKYGAGSYSLGIGSNGSYYSTPYHFEAK